MDCISCFISFGIDVYVDLSIPPIIRKKWGLRLKVFLPVYRSALSGTPNTKASPATPRSGKPVRGVAKPGADKSSYPQNGGLSADRSSKPIPSKTTVNRLSPKISTPPDVSLSKCLSESVYLHGCILKLVVVKIPNVGLRNLIYR